MAALKEPQPGSKEYEQAVAAQFERNREIDLLRTNNRTHERNAETYKRNEASLKKQIVDLQAQLLASQDRVAELQHMLLDLRAARAA